MYEMVLFKNITLFYLGVFYNSILHYLKMKVINILTIWNVKTTNISQDASCTVKILLFCILAPKSDSFCLHEKFSCP